MHFIIELLILALNAYFWIIIATVMASWLVVFGVLNTRNKYVRKLCELLNRATDPAILRLRRVIPPVGGIDLTPMAVIFIIYFLNYLLAYLDASFH
jgi:YggT family protein